MNSAATVNGAAIGGSEIEGKTARGAASECWANERVNFDFIGGISSEGLHQFL